MLHMETMLFEQTANPGRRVTIRKEQADRPAGLKFKLLSIHLHSSRAIKSKIRHNASGPGVLRTRFGAEANGTVCSFDAEVEQECQQPFASQSIVILRKDFLHTGIEVSTRRQIGAQQQKISRQYQLCQPGEDGVRFEVRDHSKE